MHKQRFTFLCSKEERSSLERIATFYCRSKGDTVRLLIRQAFEKINKPTNAHSEVKEGFLNKEHVNDRKTA